MYSATSASFLAFEIANYISPFVRPSTEAEKMPSPGREKACHTRPTGVGFNPASCGGLSLTSAGNFQTIMTMITSGLRQEQNIFSERREYNTPGRACPKVHRFKRAATGQTLDRR
jgi:hypothetical protein